MARKKIYGWPFYDDKHREYRDKEAAPALAGVF